MSEFSHIPGLNQKIEAATAAQPDAVDIAAVQAENTRLQEELSALKAQAVAQSIGESVGTVAALEAQITALKERRVTALVEAAVAEKGLNAEQQATLAAMALQSDDHAIAILDAIPTALPDA